jgi:hypothetical protein
VAGDFDAVGGARRPWVAQFDGTTGLATDWTPDSRMLDPLRFFGARSILSNGQSTFVGGWFDPALEHSGLFGFDRAGNVLPWVPTLECEDVIIVGSQPTARALAQHGNTLYVGGRFNTIATKHLPNLAAIDATTGEVLPWDPDLRGGYANPFDAVEALAIADDMLYVGGRFTRLGGYPSRGFAALALPPSPASRQVAIAPATARGVSLALTPNPSRSRVRFAFSLSAPATVSLGVYDIAGRRVAAPLDRNLERAGDHTFTLDTTHLRAGVYYGRLDAGTTLITRRFVVLD